MKKCYLFILFLVLLISVSASAQKRGVQKLWTENSPECEGILINFEVDNVQHFCVRFSIWKKTNKNSEYSFLVDHVARGGAGKQPYMYGDYFSQYHQGSEINEVNYIVYFYAQDERDCETIIDTLSIDTTTFIRTCFNRTVPNAIPSVLTPNSDGNNDFFSLPYDEPYTISIYNTFGQQLFRQKNTDGNGWDGGYYAASVYFWTAKFDDPLKRILSGKVVLVR